MSDDRAPFLDADDTSAQDKATERSRALLVAYKRCFTSDAGKTVLADLKSRFGFMKWEANDSHDPNVILRRTLAKGPLFHIQEQLDTPVAARRKQKPAQPSP